jgi:predicted acetyltransferase
MGLSLRRERSDWCDGSGLSFRCAKGDDLERLIDVHTSAFPDARGRDVRARNFTGNPLGALEDLWVALARDSGTIVAHGFLFPLKAWFGGALVPVGGVASVGVAPEVRGCGVGSALVEHLHAVSHARGDALTVLYPYRRAFYARLGYAPTSTYRRLRLSPASVPWSLELRPRAAAGDDDRAAMRECWEEAGARRSGTLARSERFWDWRLSDEASTWLVVEGDGGVEGYLAWSLRQSEPHAATTMLVREMTARNDTAMRSLWALIGAQRGQVAEVQVDVALDDPVDRALVDADRARPGNAHLEHALGDVAAGPMLRVVDARRALEARGYSAEGRLLIALGDETLELVVRGGRGVVAGTGSAGGPLVRMDAVALGAIAFGALPASQAQRLGWLVAPDARSVALADELLSLPAYFSSDPF